MKHAKKILSVALALALCLGLSVPAFAAGPVTDISRFTDVSPGAYYFKGVNWVVEQGITNGTSPTTFSPSDDCTNIQILTFLWRLAGRPGAGNAELSWNEEQALVTSWANSKGIDVRYPNSYCSRGEAVTYMWKVAGTPAPTVTAEYADVLPYSDYAKPVSWAVEKGITNGSGGLTFSPSIICSRGQIATFLYRQAAEPLEVELPSREGMLDEFLRLINEKRAEAGAPALETYATLDAAAQIRSEELAASVSHTRPDGTDYTTALTQTGADQNVTASDEVVTAGGSDNPSGLMESYRLTQKMGDRSLSVLLDPRFTHVGIGYTYVDQGQYRHYWDLILAAVDGSPNNSAVPEDPKANWQYDENGVLVSTDPIIKLSALTIDDMTTASIGYTGLNMNITRWCGSHGEDYAITWSTDAPDVVSLIKNGTYGVSIKAQKAGTATVTCTVTGQDGYAAEAYCYVTIQPQAGSQTPDSGGSDGAQMCQRVLELVNQERAKEGLSALSTTDALSAAADVRAKELVTLFSHSRPDGSQCFTALSEAGIRYRAAGENIAAGQRTPEEVVDDWMHSSGHRANILNSAFTQIGVGYYNGNWVQLFIG